MYPLIALSKVLVFSTMFCFRLYIAKINAFVNFLFSVLKDSYVPLSQTNSLSQFLVFSVNSSTTFKKFIINCLQKFTKLIKAYTSLTFIRVSYLSTALTLFFNMCTLLALTITLKNSTSSLYYSAFLGISLTQFCLNISNIF